jgi:hypothetical protein
VIARGLVLPPLEFCRNADLHIAAPSAASFLSVFAAHAVGAHELLDDELGLQSQCG